VKIINPNDKGGYKLEQLQTKYPKLTTVDQIRSELTEQLKAFVDGASCEFGYLFLGHGLKGKQRVIENDEDVAMYADYKGKRHYIVDEVFWEATFISKAAISFSKCKRPTTHIKAVRS